MHYGLSKEEIEEIIQAELDKNPDLKYYINNSYFDEFISLLIDGISNAIIQNTEKTIQDYETELSITGRMRGY